MIKEKFGVCFWLLNKDRENILLGGNQEDFDKLDPQGKVFDIFPHIENLAYYQIRYGTKEFIILQEAMLPINDLVLQIGLKVKEKNKIGLLGTIAERIWHFKENKTFYYILINNKLSSKRYFSEDLSVMS